MSSPIKATWQRTFAPLAIYDLRLFFTGQSVSLIGTWLQATAQALLVFQLSRGSSFAVAVAACCNAVPLILLGPTLSNLTGGISRRNLVMVTQIVELILAAILGVMAHSGVATVHMVYLLALLLGCTESLYFPAMQGLLGELAGSAHIRSAVGINAVISNIARFTGPTLAGLLIASFGVSTAFFVNSASFVPVIVSLALLYDGKAKHDKKEHWTLLETAKYLRSETNLCELFAAVALMNVFGQSCYALIPGLEAGNARMTGLLLGAAGLGSLLSALCVMPFLQVFRRPGCLLSVALIWMGSTLALTAVFHTFALQFASMWAVGLSTTILFVTSLGKLQTVPPAPAWAGLFGLFSACFYGSQPVAALALGLIADYGSVRHTIQGSAILEVLGSLLLLCLPTWRRWRPEDVRC